MNRILEIQMDKEDPSCFVSFACKNRRGKLYHLSTVTSFDRAILAPHILQKGFASGPTQIIRLEEFPEMPLCVFKEWKYYRGNLYESFRAMMRDGIYENFWKDIYTHIWRYYLEKLG